MTQQDAHTLPQIEQSLDALASSSYFSILDLTSGYWQAPLDLSDYCHYTSIFNLGKVWDPTIQVNHLSETILLSSLHVP